MTTIAKRFLKEIQDIADNRYDLWRVVTARIRHHWDYPTLYNELFGRCKPFSAAPNIDVACGCLTQIRGVPLQTGINAYALDRNGVASAELTEQIRNDQRLARTPGEILPAAWSGVVYPLNEAQKQELTTLLLPYAEWQTRLHLLYGDIPEDELVEVEMATACGNDSSGG